MHSFRETSYAYGLWGLVIFNVLLFGLFVLSFLTPVQRREWRSFGVFSAFLVALFTEMYGFPLTIYVLTAILGANYPSLNPFSHASGHLWLTLLGGGDLTMALVHLLSDGLLVTALILMGAGWRRIYAGKGELVTEGIYARVRHPQYTGLFLVIVGMLIQWPTILTVLMAPVLAWTYYRLTRREERDLEERFGEAYRRYRERVPMFVPRLRRRVPDEPPAGMPETQTPARHLPDERPSG